MENLEPCLWVKTSSVERAYVDDFLIAGVRELYVQGGNTARSSTIVVASGKLRRCLRQTNLADVRWVGLRHRWEPMFATICVLLDDLTQVGLVAGERSSWASGWNHLQQRECNVGVISWHDGKLARVARSWNAAARQAAADAAGELTQIRLSLWEIFGAMRPRCPLRNHPSLRCARTGGGD